MNTGEFRQTVQLHDCAEVFISPAWMMMSHSLLYGTHLCISSLLVALVLMTKARSTFDYSNQWLEAMWAPITNRVTD